VEDAVEKLDASLRAKVKAAVEKYKPEVITKLNDAKKVIIDLEEGGKNIVIQIKGEIVKIYEKWGDH